MVRRSRTAGLASDTLYPLVTIFNKYIYDQVGRKLKTWGQIQNLNNTPTTNTLISRVDYNEIGQAGTKRLHSTTDSVNSTGFLQNIAYTYNERGWLQTSSASPWWWILTGMYEIA